MVSVVIPLYNKRNFIGRAIESIIRQTWQDFEIIVVDDGSNDDSARIVQSFKDARIHLVSQVNAGPGAARNRGAREAASEFVAFLDADDEYLPDFLQRSIRNLLDNTDCALSASNHYRGAEKVLATSIFPFNIGIETGPWRLPADCEPNVLWGSLIFMQTWVTVCRRNVLLEYGGFYERHCTYAEDQYCWLQILLNRRIYRDLTPLFWYHSENSELEMFSRASTTPIWPFLTDPDPIRESCPAEYRQALERLFTYAAVLNYSYIVSDESIVSFWREHLRGIPSTHDMPLDRPRPVDRSGKTGRVCFVINQELSIRVRSECGARGISTKEFFLACLAFLVWKYSAQETIVLGTPYETREREEREGLFGCYIRTIPIRIDMDGEAELPSWLGHVKARYAAAWEHASIGPEELIDAVGVSRPTNANAVCQLAFAMQDGLEGTGDAMDFALSFTRRGISGNDIALFMTGTDRFEAVLEYSVDLFDADSMDLFAANFTRVARGLSGGFEARLDSVELIDAGAVELVDRTNRTDAPEFLGRTILDLFEESLADSGDSVAVKSIEDGVSLTYSELDELSDGIALKLTALGASGRSLVGLYMNRDRWLLPSFLGILKAGCAYVPINPIFPRDRNAGIVKNAGIRFIATTSELAPEAAAFGDGLFVARVDDGEKAPWVELPPVRPGQVAYVLFTSGSTGQPKGVPIRHESVANLLLSMRAAPGLSREDKVLALATVTFDMSVPEFYLPLTCGASLVLVDYETSLDSAKLASLIESERITFMQATPSRWPLLFEAGWKCSPSMTLLTGGEALPQALAMTLQDTGASVWNMYGPTETTVWSSKHRLRREDATPSIGMPIANTGFFVLDGGNRLLPPGMRGELGISGAGLSEGYLNRPDLSAGRFIVKDINGFQLCIYKTGDLVQQRPAGDFRYFGRNDFQVKIRGFRIELGEIESLMLGFHGIKEAVCAVWNRSERDQRIVAYYRRDSPVDEKELRAHLKRSLPEYMVPGHYVPMAEFPRTSSGKTDRKALPPPAAMGGEEIEDKSTVNAMQGRILEIWKEVLGNDTIGVDENFFDLGGHSVLAVELVRKLNARIGGAWKLRDLFEHPTIEGLASMVGSEKRSKLPLLFSINRKGERNPLFIVPGVYSNNYYEDANYSEYEHDFLRYFNNFLVLLGRDRPVYGLRPRGIYCGERFHRNVEAMASEYINEIKAVRPEGPYLIAGECIGGVVAHSIACQLRELGDEVSKLVMLDTYRMNAVNEKWMRTKDLHDDCWAAFQAFRRIALHFEIDRGALRRAGEWARIHLFPLDDELREIRRLVLGPRKYSNLLLRYRPKRYDGEALLIINEEWNDRHPFLSWDTELCPRLEVRIVPGNHSTRLKYSGGALERCLREDLD
jgi:amino acid adenylation domain-containing protein